MFPKLLLSLFLVMGFSPRLVSQTYDVLPPEGRHELFHNYLLQELDKTMRARDLSAEKALQSKKQLQNRQNILLQNYLHLLGTLPSKSPLSPTITGTIEGSVNYRIEKIHFQSRPNHHVTGNFYLPTTGSAPYPAVLVLSGHYPIAKAYPYYQKLCISLARQGIVAFIVDPICQGERYQVLDTAGQLSMLGQSGTGAHSRLDVGAVLTGTSIVAYELWDNHRALDYLFSRTDVVDTTRIGCTGHSGGGAQATYLMAFDSRIKVATVANFITGERSMFQESGPQTGSQNLSYEGKYGIDQADYVTLFAPRPLLMIGTTTDAIFKIEAARQTLDAAKKVYAVLDAPKEVRLFETNDTHDYTQPKREATVQWYTRHFMKEERNITEGELATLSPAELQVTPTGQVQTSFSNEQNICDLNTARALHLKDSRNNFWENMPYPRCLDTIKQLIQYEALHEEPIQKVTEVRSEKSYNVEKSSISYQNHVPVTALTFVPKVSNQKLPAVLYVDGRGKETDAGNDGWITRHYLQAENPHIVMTVDVCGFGETTDSRKKNERKHNNREHRNAVISFYLGKTLVGQRVQDIEKAMQVLCSRADVDTSQLTLVGVDRASVAVLHAAALDTRFKKVVIRQASETPWIDAVTNPNIPDQMTHEVPGVLKYYTLNELVTHVLTGKTVNLIRE